MKKFFIVLVSVLLLTVANNVSAALPTIELVPNGTGSFSVQATNFANIDSFEMLIQYNPLALQSPQVAPGDMIVGGTFIPNVTHSRSTVKIVYMNQKVMASSGRLATIRFTPITGGAARSNVNILDDGYKFSIGSPVVRKTDVRLKVTADQNLGRAENNAIVACLNDSRNCTAEVQPDGSVSIIYKTKTAVNGLCGSSSGTVSTVAPSTDLCSQGSPSSVSGSGPWYWGCSGADGGTSANCIATKTPDAVNGVCGAATGRFFTSTPTDNLCSEGIASAVIDGEVWSWNCLGVNRGRDASCSANKSLTQVDGKCGAANGVTTSSKPMLLCSAGTPSDVAESSSSWSWSCNGFNGGGRVSCSASTPATLANQYAVQTGQTSSIAFVTQSLSQTASTQEKKPDSQPLVTDLRKDMTLPVGGAEAVAPTDQKAPAKKVDDEPKFVAHKGVMQYFAGYKGERIAKSFISLFAEASVPAFLQEPQIALSDGKSVIRLKFMIKSPGEETPRYILHGGSLKGVPKAGEDGYFSVDILPKKGAYDVKLTAIYGERLYEFPLTVAPVITPVIAKEKKFSLADFDKYLAKGAKFDLNNDKKFDYVDDFIYTANYIIAMKIKPEKLKKDQTKNAEAGKSKEQPVVKDDKTKKANEKSKEKEKDKTVKPDSKPDQNKAGK